MTLRALYGSSSYDQLAKQVQTQPLFPIRRKAIPKDEIQEGLGVLLGYQTEKGKNQ